MELSRQTSQDLAEVIHRLCGLVIGQNKTYLVRHRLEPLIHRYRLDGFEQLLQRLRTRAEPELHDAVIDAITTKETSFFRDHAVFKALQQQVLPECAKRLQGAGGRRHRIRIWSAGSSTGQEAYSLAMLVCELVEADIARKLCDNHFSILASDISTTALAAAQAGRYARAEVARGLTDSLLRRHFIAERKHWVAGEPLRRLVRFLRFNLLHSPIELGPFDLVLCRNVLIYFDEPTQRRVCEALYGILHDGGWLVLGAAESLHGVEDRMEAIKVGKAVLYRKLQTAG